MRIQRIPIDLQQAVIQCCGKCFHYKTDLKALLLRCGVSESVYIKYEQLEKFKIARSILSDLDQIGENGIRVQHSIVAEFSQIRTLQKDLPDLEGAKSALITLKTLAAKQQIVSAEEEHAISERIRTAAKIREMQTIRASNMEVIRSEFGALVTAKDAEQVRGYNFEKLLGRLFEIYEIEYRPPFKSGAEQTDGLALYKNHHYLLEARWRKEFPTLGDLREFREKVKAKLDGSRGIFFSISGFREEVVAEFRTNENPVILFDGRDLTEIIDERISLLDALDAKLEHAAKTGSPFFSICNGH